MEIIDGRITDYDERGEMVIRAHRNGNKGALRKYLRAGAMRI